MKLCTTCKSDKDVRLSRKIDAYLCRKHRAQIYRFGEIRNRTLSDKNEFVLKRDYAEMVIFDRDSKEKCRALIDKEDVEKVKNAGSWCCDTSGYVMNGKYKKLHGFLLGKKNGYEIDHINRDKLDNRRKNLRFVLHRINTMNRYTINAYQYESGKWCSYVYYKGEKVHLGTFDTFEEADSKAQKVKDYLIDGDTINEALGKIL